MTDLSAPSLAGLAYALRHPELWPKEFIWDAAHPHKNPVGLAFKLWNGPRSFDDSTDSYLFDLAKLVGTNEVEMLCTHREPGQSKCSPASVAARIEKYLSKNPIR